MGAVEMPARGSVREHRGALELSAYAGINPATGRKEYRTERLPLDTPEAEVGRRLTALVHEADELLDARRRRRKNGTTEPEPARLSGKAERTVTDALDGWFTERGQYLARSAEASRAVEMFKSAIGEVKLWQLRGTLDATDTDADAVDLIDLSAVGRRLTETGSSAGGPLAVSTVRSRFSSVLSPALERAIERQWLGSNPCRKVVLPKTAGTAATDEDIEPEPAFEFLAFVADHAPHLYGWVLCVGEGPRPFEASAIRRGNLDLDAGTLRLRAEGVVRAKVKKGEPERWEVVGGETPKRRRRLINLPPEVVEALRVVVREQDRAALEAGVKLGPRAFVFASDPAGEDAMNPHAMGTLFARYVARAAGLDGEPGRGRRRPSSYRKPNATIRPAQLINLPDGFSPYSFRHLGITSMLAGGARPKAVAERYATSEEMIHEKYSHLIAGEDAALAAASSAKLAPLARIREQQAAVGGNVVPMRRRR